MKNIPRILFSLLIGLSFTAQAQAAGDGHVNKDAEPLPAHILKRLSPDENRPNAPSLARHTLDRHPKITDWEDPSICGGCHTKQYEGWKGSMHSNSFKDPIFQAEWALAEKALGPQISKLCGGCHSPAGMLSDTIKFDPKKGKHGGFTAPPLAENGVFCDVCHTISGSSYDNSETQEHGNGSYIASPGPIKRGPLKDAKSPYHQTEYSEHHKQAAFCGNCHNIFNPLNNFPLERTYDEWKYSVYAQNNVQCQDCHMVPVATAKRVADELKPARELKDHGLGGVAGIGAKGERDLVHGHGFVGGNAVVTALLGDPDSRRHAGIAIERLRSVADVDVHIESVPGQGRMHEVAVKVTNARAGHHIPTSLTFVRELWLDVSVLDENGKVLFRSGALDEHQEVDPKAFMFRAYAVDKNGDPAKYIWTVQRFERRTTIPPKGSQTAHYFVNVPEGVGNLTVRAKLNYRSFSPHFAEHLLGKDKLEVPTITMNDVEARFSLSDMSATYSVDHLAQADLEAETAKLLEDHLGPVAAKTAEELARPCAACHGKDGIGRQDDIPNIAGQNELYLTTTLRAYRDGTRKDERMNAMTKALSEEEIAKLAKYFQAM